VWAHRGQGSRISIRLQGVHSGTKGFIHVYIVRSVQTVGGGIAKRLKELFQPRNERGALEQGGRRI
jgi:hypothetical protein